MDLMEIDGRNKRAREEEPDLRPTKVIIVEFVPMDIDEPPPPFLPIPLLVRAS